MALIEIPDDLFEQMKKGAVEAVDKILLDEIVERAGKFINVTDLGTKGMLLKHVLTGKTLHITARWVEEEKNK